MSVRLFILGLAMRGETHGYEIKEVARRWGVERWARFGFGSIYHALGKLEEEGFLTEVGASQEGNRPPRYVYKITPAGRSAFYSLLRESCATAETESREIDMALAFIHYLPPEERIALLQKRLEGLQPRLESLTNNIAALESDRTLPAWVAPSVRHSLGRVAFECEWTKQVLKTVADWPAAAKSEEETHETA